MGTTDPLIGRLIDGRYQVRSRIARGGMATVYLATDLRLERRVAVKIMHGHLADDSRFKQRFIQEARSAARLAHPNVVNVFDQGQDEDSAYLVMEYLPGITLRDLLHDYGALTSEQTLDITEAVLSGLAAAHKAGIVHRDLKPENVLLADDGRIKIGDFGLARAASANTATGAALLGTIAYLSPELVTRGVADARSDIYAVGIMVYEMLTGEQPYRGEQPMQIAYQHANDQVPAPSTRNGRVPAELDEIVLWATSREPDQRPADARELLDSVHRIERSGTTAQRTAVLKTAVLPPATTRRPGAEDATEVLGVRRQAATAPVPPAGPVAPDPTSALATSARKRGRRGWLVALLILLLVAASAGVGWWFTFGPGGRVSVPDVANTLPAAATQQLRADGFVVAAEQRQDFSTEVANGKVIGTDPKSGAFAAKGASVILIVSKGPRPIALPRFAGQSEEAALALVRESWTEQESRRRFDAKVPKDTVIEALGTGDAVLAEGAPYGEEQPITLVVSAGAVPPVAGKSVEEATATLTAVGLKVNPQTKEATSETIAKGSVIGLDGYDGSQVLKPGDTVTLVVSTGPPPVTIPADIVGKNWAVARKQLTDLGFKLDYNNREIADRFPQTFSVKSVDPEAGSSAPKGSTLTLKLQFVEGD